MEFLKNKIHLVIYNILVIFLLIAVFIYGKKVTVYMDDREEVVSTNIISVDYFVARYAEDNNIDEYIFEVNHSNDSLLNNSVITIESKKTITVLYEDKEYEITTYNSTYDDLAKSAMNEIGLTEDEESTDPNVIAVETEYLFRNENNRIEDGMVLELVKLQTVTVAERKEETLAQKEIPDDSMNVGARVVQSVGTPNVYSETYEIILLDGEEYSRVMSGRELVQEGVAGTVKVGTKAITFNPENGNVWDQLAQCEAGGNWAANTGNGFYGGLQFSADTWTRAASNVGVTIPYAHQASREVQIMVAEDWLSRTSWAQWPACSKKLGLR